MGFDSSFWEMTTKICPKETSPHHSPGVQEHLEREKARPLPEKDIFARHVSGFWQFSLMESFLLNPQKFGGSSGLRFSIGSPIRTDSALRAVQSIV